MRYRVIEGSQSSHCCFEWTVIDTYVGFEAVCECFDEADAKMIAEALNLNPRPSSSGAAE